MKIGIRKRSFAKSFKAMTTGKLKRKLKRLSNPFYGKKNINVLKNPEKYWDHKVYHKLTVEDPGLYTHNYVAKKPQRVVASEATKPPSISADESWFKKHKRAIIIVIIAVILVCAFGRYINGDTGQIGGEAVEENPSTPDILADTYPDIRKGIWRNGEKTVEFHNGRGCYIKTATSSDRYEYVYDKDNGTGSLTPDAGGDIIEFSLSDKADISTFEYDGIKLIINGEEYTWEAIER